MGLVLGFADLPLGEDFFGLPRLVSPEGLDFADVVGLQRPKSGFDDFDLPVLDLPAFRLSAFGLPAYDLPESGLVLFPIGFDAPRPSWRWSF